MAIARSPITVVDCPDPGILATFYGDLLDWDVDVDEDGSWAEAYGEDGALSFQRVEDFRAPTWPGQQHPQQMHIDVEVDDIDAAEPEVLAIGASLHDEQPSVDGGFRVYLDPAGHPFCLCRADDD